MTHHYSDKKVQALVLILLKKNNQPTKNIKAIRSESLKIILPLLDNRVNKNMTNILNHHPKPTYLKGLSPPTNNTIKRKLLTVNNNRKSTNTDRRIILSRN